MPTLQADFLQGYVKALLIDAGCQPTQAAAVADNLVQANLKGHDSHGVGMIPRYVAAIREGSLNLQGAARQLAHEGPFIRFDGERGFGQITGAAVMERAIAQVKAGGIAVTSLANSHHLGRIGAFAEQAAAAGFISIHFVNVYFKPVVVPWGGLFPRLGTNPFCVGIPTAHGEPIILDFATSIIASGKARVAYNKGEPLTPGLAVDHQGQPTTDPKYLVEEPLGGLLTFGEHKGSGLAFICSLLGAALTGGLTECGADTLHDQAIINSMLSIVIDPRRLGGAHTFEQEIQALIPWVKSAAPDGKLYLPGEVESASQRQRQQDGIELDNQTWNDIVQTGKQLVPLHDQALST